MNTLHCDKFWAWNRTVLNLWGIVAAILKMATGRIFSMSGINSGHHNLPTYEMSLKSDMLILCGIVVAILKMATGRKFSILGINSWHHYLPTYQILMISDNVEFLLPFWKWRPLGIFQCRDIIIYPQCGKRLLTNGEWKFQVASKIHFILAGLASRNLKTLATITGYSFKISELPNS